MTIDLTQLLDNTSIEVLELDESDVDEVEKDLESEITTEQLPVYLESDTIPEDVSKYITAESLTDDETDEVIVMTFMGDTWVEKPIDLGEPEDLIIDDLEEKEQYTWIVLSEDESSGTLSRITWSQVEDTE